MNEVECKCMQCGWCCTDMEIRIRDLIDPKATLPKKGYDFWEIHGLQDIWESNGMIKIVHKCQHLTSNNLCGIEETKPDFCRDWICRRHLQNRKWYEERVADFARDALNKMTFLFHTSETPDNERIQAIGLLLSEYECRIEDLKKEMRNDPE